MQILIHTQMHAHMDIEHTAKPLPRLTARQSSMQYGATISVAASVWVAIVKWSINRYCYSPTPFARSLPDPHCM